MNNVIKISNISKIYHSKDGEVKAIDDISFNVLRGEYVSIVGPSGCGKSTLLNIIGGIDYKSYGNIIKDNNIKIGYMLQDDCLFPWLNILDNCILGLKIRNEVNDDNKNYVIKLLKEYGLGEFIYKYPSSLSGGMKQRVALIRTLAIKPDILLLDEPFSALDYQTRLAVEDDIYKIIKDSGKSVIMITHDIAEAISMSDRVIVLSNRPSRVKKVINILLENKGMPTDNRKCPEFNKYYDMIWKEIDYNDK